MGILASVKEKQRQINLKESVVKELFIQYENPSVKEKLNFTEEMIKLPNIRSILRGEPDDRKWIDDVLAHFKMLHSLDAVDIQPNMMKIEMDFKKYQRLFVKSENRVYFLEKLYDLMKETLLFEVSEPVFRELVSVMLMIQEKLITQGNHDHDAHVLYLLLQFGIHIKFPEKNQTLLGVLRGIKEVWHDVDRWYELYEYLHERKRDEYVNRRQSKGRPRKTSISFAKLFSFVSNKKDSELEEETETMLQMSTLEEINDLLTHVKDADDILFRLAKVLGIESYEIVRLLERQDAARIKDFHKVYREERIAQLHRETEDSLDVIAKLVMPFLVPGRESLQLTLVSKKWHRRLHQSVCENAMKSQRMLRFPPRKRVNLWSEYLKFTWPDLDYRKLKEKALADKKRTSYDEVIDLDVARSLYQHKDISRESLKNLLVTYSKTNHDVAKKPMSRFSFYKTLEPVPA
jgi:hypothetical protein